MLQVKKNPIFLHLRLRIAIINIFQYKYFLSENINFPTICFQKTRKQIYEFDNFLKTLVLNVKTRQQELDMLFLIYLRGLLQRSER